MAIPPSTGMMAPVIIVANRKQLKEMRNRVDAYRVNTMQDLVDPQEEFKATLKTLYSLKKKVWIGDKKSVAEADDIIAEFTDLN